MSRKSLSPGESDGRTLRSQRTRREIVEAYILLLREHQHIPTLIQVAARVGYSLRTMYLHFSDVVDLGIAACDYAVQQGLAIPLGDKPQAGRHERIEFQVEVRARNCENWLPLWRMLLHYQHMSPELERRVKLVRHLVVERMQTLYRPELSVLPETERKALLWALESMTDYESWGRLRGAYGLSCEEARQAWIIAIDHLLPSTPSPKVTPVKNLTGAEAASHV